MSPGVFFFFFTFWKPNPQAVPGKYHHQLASKMTKIDPCMSSVCGSTMRCWGRELGSGCQPLPGRSRPWRLPRASSHSGPAEPAAADKDQVFKDTVRVGWKYWQRVKTGKFQRCYVACRSLEGRQARVPHIPIDSGTCTVLMILNIC